MPASAATTTTNGDGRPRIVVVVALLLVVASAFASTWSGQFVYDDLTLIAQNPGLRDPFDLVGLWTRPLWGEQLGHWRPLTSQLLAQGLWLDGGGAHAIHAMAITAHLASTFAVLDVARRLGLAPGAAAATALVFAVHPAQAEPVAWCAGLNDALVGAFALLGLSRWLAWLQEGHRRERTLAVAFAVLAALAKEPGVLSPLLYAGAAFARGEGFATTLRRTVPLLAIAVAWFAARVLVFGELAAGLGRSTYTPPDHGVGHSLAVGLGLVRHLVWPVDLGMFEAPSLGAAPVLAGIALAALFVATRGAPAARTGFVLVAFAVLPPMLTVRSLGPYPVADRYLYVACAGLALTFGALSMRMRHGHVWLSIACGLPFLVGTALRVPTWHDQPGFVADALARYPDDPRLHLMQAQLDLERAGADREAAARVLPSLQRARTLLGNDLAKQDHLAQLRRDVAVALAWQVASQPARNGQPDWLATERAFQQVVQDWPACADGHVGLGVARAATGRLELAERDLRHAIGLDPGIAPAHHNLARVLYERGDKRGAREQLLEAVRIRPDDQASRALLDVLAREGVR